MTNRELVVQILFDHLDGEKSTKENIEEKARRIDTLYSNAGGRESTHAAAIKVAEAVLLWSHTACSWKEIFAAAAKYEKAKTPLPQLTDEERANLAKRHTPVADWPDTDPDLIRKEPAMLTAAKAAEVLNEALKLDPAAITTLFTIRRDCNKQLAEHEHVIVGVGGTLAEPRYIVGFLGVLNGLLTAAGSPEVVAMQIDDENNQNIVKFSVRLKDGLEPKATAEPQKE